MVSYLAARPIQVSSTQHTFQAPSKKAGKKVAAAPKKAGGQGKVAKVH